MRDLHSKMLAAVLDGEGLRGVAELAAVEAGGPVAIVLPARGLAAASDEATDLERLTRVATARIEQRPPDSGDAREAIGLALPIHAGDQTIGFVMALSQEANGGLPIDREEILRTAGLVALTEVAVTDARDEVAGELRGSLLEDLRSRQIDGDEATRRASRLGCDLTKGAVALVAELRTSRPRHAAAVITGDHPGAVAEALPTTGPDGESHDRIYALLPARGDQEIATQTLTSARDIAARLRAQGPAAFSSFCDDPADLGRAVAEAELMLDVISRDDRMASQLSEGIGDGIYRLLFRALASDPEEVRRFYRDTVEALVDHDRQYRTDLLGTLEAYLANDCNMNATARAVYAHRHTVAHRLSRVRELTDLDPALGEDRERLGLGIKAYRILEPTLPK